MAEVASRELQEHARQLARRVEAGESVTITVNGRPVATLEPVGACRRWNDSSIAATAISLGAAVVTQDDDYDDAPGLAVIRV